MKLKTVLFLVACYSLGTPLAVVSAGEAVAAEAPDWPACGRIDSWPGEAWPKAAVPESWDESALAEARSIFDGLETDSLMVVYRGSPVIAWGSVADPLTIQSMRKPVLGALIGQLVAAGRLALGQRLEDLQIQDSEPPLTKAERQVTLEELLLARSGILHDANYEVGSWRRLRLALREDGDWQRGLWFYNNWDFNALGTIAEQAAGEKLGPLLQERIASPLQMQDFDGAGHVSYSGRGSRAQQHFGYASDLPAYMFEMSTRDLARFALLYLGCGAWDGREVVPADWVLASTEGVDSYRNRGENGFTTGFDAWGYLWFVENGGLAPRFPELVHAQPFYGGSGNRGHFMLVFPHLDLVLVHQPRTLGGISDEDQMRRARSRSPEVDERDFAALVQQILAAHPALR